MWYTGMFNIPIDISGEYGEKTRNRRMLNKFKDNLAFQINFSKCVEDALNRYDIEGLPETMSKRVILQSLLFHASVVFFKKDGNLFALPGVATEEFNVYGEPGFAETFSVNGTYNERVKLYIEGTDKTEFLKTLNAGNGEAQGCILWENKKRFPYIYSVIFFAQAIADTYRTLDTCRANIKNPQIFYGEESMRQTVEKYLEMREANCSAGYISTGILEADKLKVVPFDPKGTQLSDVTSLIEWYDNKLKERNGVKNNSQMDKKGENLIEAEVDVTDEATKKNASDVVEYLNEQMETINEFMGTNIKFVDKNEDEEEEEESNGEDLRSDDSGRKDNISD